MSNTILMSSASHIQKVFNEHDLINKPYKRKRFIYKYKITNFKIFPMKEIIV